MTRHQTIGEVVRENAEAMVRTSIIISASAEAVMAERGAGPGRHSTATARQLYEACLVIFDILHGTGGYTDEELHDIVKAIQYEEDARATLRVTL